MQTKKRKKQNGKTRVHKRTTSSSRSSSSIRAGRKNGSRSLKNDEQF